MSYAREKYSAMQKELMQGKGSSDAFMEAFLVAKEDVKFEDKRINRTQNFHKMSKEIECRVCGQCENIVSCNYVGSASVMTSELHAWKDLSHLDTETVSEKKYLEMKHCKCEY